MIEARLAIENLTLSVRQTKNVGFLKALKKNVLWSMVSAQSNAALSFLAMDLKNATKRSSRNFYNEVLIRINTLKFQFLTICSLKDFNLRHPVQQFLF